MRTKYRLSAILVAIIALAVLVSGSTAAYANGGSKAKKLRLTAVENQFEFLDLGTPGPSLGDELVFSETLSRNGREVGDSGVVCTVVQAVPPYDVLTYHCVGTLRLRKGQITLQGLIDIQGEDDPGPFTVAITGGTGKFKCAGGQATVRVGETRSVYKLKIQNFCKDKKHKKHKHHRTHH